MATVLVRYKRDEEIRWGIVNNDKVTPIREHFPSLADVLNADLSFLNEASELSGETISVDDLELLSPVTTPARIVCQGVNYANHRKEAGLEAQRPDFNLLFTKADSSLCGPNDEIVRPEHVELLDYEIELGLVIRSPIEAQTTIHAENLYDYVAGLVLTNDVSARDVQIPQGQWFKGKSYRTFCPAGPYLYLWDRNEITQLDKLELKLWVNGELRQSTTTANLLYKPTETLQEISEVMNLDTGDLVMTGTPGGVALKMSSHDFDEQGSTSYSGEKKRELILESQKGNGGFLKDGDLVTCEIVSEDGTINLGKQNNRVVSNVGVESRG